MNAQQRADAFEAAYWRFDTLHRQGAGAGPMSERDAFKASVGQLLASAGVTSEGKHAWLMFDKAALTTIRNALGAFISSQGLVDQEPHPALAADLERASALSARIDAFVEAGGFAP
jgi:hypothetical protein